MSLHPIRSKRKPKGAKAYGRLKTEHGWDTGEKKPYTPGRISKIAILSVLVLTITIVPTFAYYQFNIAPLIGGSASSKDPFTTIWNGQQAPGGNATQFQGYTVNSQGGSMCGANCLSNGATTRGVGQGFRAPYSGNVTKVSLFTGSTPPNRLVISTSNFAGTPATSSYACSGPATCYVQNAGQAYAVQDVQTIAPPGNNYVSITLTTQVPVSAGQWVAVTFMDTIGIANIVLVCGAGGSQSCGNACLPTCVEPGLMSNLEFDFGSTTPSGNANTIISDAGDGIVGITFHTLLPPCAVGFKCLNSFLDANANIVLTANATFPAIAETTGTVTLANCASKACSFSMDGYSPAGLTNGQDMAWFLSANSTLSQSAGYNPLNDTSVGLVVYEHVLTSSTADFYVYIQKQNGQTLWLGSTDPGTNCTLAATLFLCVKAGIPNNTNDNFLGLTLNFTGGTNPSNPQNSGTSYICPGSISFGSHTCILGGYASTTITFTSQVTNQTLFPWLNVQNGYYVGFWESAGASNFDFVANKGAFTPIISVYTSPQTSASATQDTGGFFGWLGKTLGGAYNIAAGALSPITAPLFSLGSSLLSAIISGLVQAGNLIIQGLSLLETVMIVAMNAVGNFLGWGNIGTNIANVISAVVAFFTSSTFANSFAFLGNAFTFLTSSGTIVVTWFNVAISFVTTGLSWAAGAIGFVATILFYLFEGISVLYATIFILLWFIDLGDYGAQGGIIWFDTTRWLFFGTGIGFIIKIFNLGLDLATYLIGMIPKPFVQMVAHAIPRIPLVEASGSPTFPEGHMQAARDGNIFTFIGWIVGAFFMVAYEGSTLPGSIGALVPAAAASTAQLNGFLPLFEVTMMLAGVTLMFLLPAKLANAVPGIFEKNLPGSQIPLSLRASSSGSRGSVGVHLRKSTKHFQSRLEKKINPLQQASDKLAKQRASKEGRF